VRKRSAEEAAARDRGSRQSNERMEDRCDVTRVKYFVRTEYEYENIPTYVLACKREVESAIQSGRRLYVDV
jgi:hypothetical protein